MEISSIAMSPSDIVSVRTADQRPETIGREFDALVLGILLKESGISESFTAGATGPESALLGDFAIQLLASELAKTVDFGSGQMIRDVKHTINQR